MNPTVVIDYLPETASEYRDRYAIVVVDVMRATTTATTAVSRGWRVFAASTTDEAYVIASRLKTPLMVGEVGGNTPYGFDITNSPVLISERQDIERPIVFVSSSGTQLMRSAEGGEAVYLACFRNFTAVADYIAGRHEKVAIIGAGTRGQFRREDQMGCAWVAERLLSLGYRSESGKTDGYIGRWSGVSPEEARKGKSADYLIKSNQVHDLDFVVSHIDDLATVPMIKNGEIIQAPQCADKKLPCI